MHYLTNSRVTVVTVSFIIHTPCAYQRVGHFVKKEIFTLRSTISYDYVPFWRTMVSLQFFYKIVKTNNHFDDRIGIV